MMFYWLLTQNIVELLHLVKLLRVRLRVTTGQVFHSFTFGGNTIILSFPFTAAFLLVATFLLDVVSLGQVELNLSELVLLQREYVLILAAFFVNGCEEFG